MRKMAVGLAILAAPTIVAAATPQWRVTETSGDVRLVQNGQARAAARNTLLTTGSTIVTGPKAKAVIVRGEEFVVISPNSQLRLPAEQNSSGIMQIIEDFGTALFKIKKKSTPHFGVQTPYLAAVVKGTTFTVTVGPEGGSVQVTEGAVEVSTLDGGAVDLITPGSIASVGAADLFRLSVQADDVKTLRSEGAPPPGTVTSSVRPDARPKFEGPRSEAFEISSPIAESSLSLGAVTGGLVEGEAAMDVALVEVSDRAALQPVVSDNPGSSNGGGNAGGLGNGSAGNADGADANNGHGNEIDRVDEGNPGSGGGGNGNGNSGNGNGNSGSGGAEESGNSGNGNSGNGNSGNGNGNSASGGGQGGPPR